MKIEGCWYSDGIDAWYHRFYPEDSTTLCGLDLKYRVKRLFKHCLTLHDDCEVCHRAVLLKELGE